MTFDEYQKKAITTLLKGPDKLTDVIHAVLGISGEAGEVSERIKKLIRDKNGDLSKLDIPDIKKEIGDVLWYLAVLSDLLGISFEDLAQSNLDKLASRKARGKLRGSGDNR
jgi:NTP pyrophosphatase (non-canonical NTP hydrolase)